MSRADVEAAYEKLYQHFGVDLEPSAVEFKNRWYYMCDFIISGELKELWHRNGKTFRLSDETENWSTTGRLPGEGPEFIGIDAAIAYLKMVGGY